MQSLTTGEMARRAGVGTDTVLYYERQGLLAPPPRRASGYRDYPPESLHRLHFIRRAKALGFSLAEIRELLALHAASAAGCAHAAARVRAKIAAIDAKIRHLETMRNGLESFAEACGRRTEATACPLLDALLGSPEPGEAR